MVVRAKNLRGLTNSIWKHRKNMAIYQGLKTVGKETQMDFLGVYVMQVADDSTFKGIFEHCGYRHR